MSADGDRSRCVTFTILVTGRVLDDDDGVDFNALGRIMGRAAVDEAREHLAGVTVDVDHDYER